MLPPPPVRVLAQRIFVHHTLASLEKSLEPSQQPLTAASSRFQPLPSQAHRAAYSCHPPLCVRSAPVFSNEDFEVRHCLCRVFPLRSWLISAFPCDRAGGRVDEHAGSWARPGSPGGDGGRGEGGGGGINREYCQTCTTKGLRDLFILIPIVFPIRVRQI